MTVPCSSSGRSFTKLTTVRVVKTQTGAPVPLRRQTSSAGQVPRVRSLSRKASRSPLKVKLPGTVRQHFLSGIKPKNPRTRLIAIYDATISFGEDDAGYVSVEQYAIEVSPHRGFF